MSADLSFTAILSSIFFFRPLPAELAEWNSTKIGHMLGSKHDLKMHVQNLGYTLPYKSGAQNHFFSTTSQLMATLTAYIFGMKHDIDNWASVLTTTRCLLHRAKMSWTSVHKQLQVGRAFLPTLREFCFLLCCQASQTEINKQNSTKLCAVSTSQRAVMLCGREVKAGMVREWVAGITMWSPSYRGPYLSALMMGSFSNGSL